MDSKKILIWCASFVLFFGLGLGITKLSRVMASKYDSGMPDDDIAMTSSQRSESSSRNRSQDRETSVATEGVRADSVSAAVEEAAEVAADANALKEKEMEEAKKKQEEIAAANRMSAGAFQSLMLNQHDVSLLGGRNPKVALNVHINVVGMRSGEYRPGDILAVRDKIANGIWQSAQVVSVSYDQQGRINGATVRPVYKSGGDSSKSSSDDELI